MIDTNESYLEKERRLFRRAVWASVLLHTGALMGLVWAARPEPVHPFQTLAVVSFAHFDPEGGEPGGVDMDEAAETPAAAPEPEPVPEPEAATEPETEPEAELEDETEKIESVSDTAAPPPPPKELASEPKLNSKPKTKPAAHPKAAFGRAERETATGGAAGGGPGQGPGGLGGGSGRGNPDELNAYLGQVRKRLAASKKYPPAARAQKLEGVARVSFLLAPDGRVLSSNLALSSGYAVLDDEVMALVRRVSPLPPRPHGLPQDNLSLIVPIQFSLR